MRPENRFKHGLKLMTEGQNQLTKSARPLRLKKELSLRELSRRMKHDVGHLSRLERGLKPWTRETAWNYYMTLMQVEDK